MVCIICPPKDARGAVAIEPQVTVPLPAFINMDMAHLIGFLKENGTAKRITLCMLACLSRELISWAAGRASEV